MSIEDAKDHVVQVEHVKGEKIKEDGAVLLVADSVLQKIPIPSNDPNDPLNFSRIRKMTVLLTTCWFSIFSLLSVSGLGSILGTIFQLYGKEHTPTEIVGLSNYASMVMSVGCVLLLPVAFVLGRRPVFLFAVLVCLICYITAATSTTFNGHVISRIFIGLATGTTESLLPLIIADVSYLDERGFYFGLYWSSQNAISAGLLIAIPYLVAATSWRWFYWFFAIAMAGSLVLAIFALPETKFIRPPMALSGRAVYTDEFGHTHVVSHEEAEQRFGAPLTAETTSSPPPPKRTFAQELKPFHGLPPNALKLWLHTYKKILQSCTAPAVIYALALASIALGIGIAITNIYSTLLQGSYHWSASSVGLFNAGAIPASICAMLYTGYFGDRLTIWLATRNGGMHKPEHLLMQLIFPVLMTVVGIVTIAVAANAPQSYSAWAMVVGWAIYQFAFTCIIITSTTYAAEAIPDCPGAGMVVVVGGKNLVSFGAAQGIIPMVAKFSYLTSLMILLGILLGIAFLGIPIYFLNQKWREVTATEIDVDA
ncbi:hypothetical protein LTR81_002337 [Elasticomyces elasticus]